ncbi:MAG: GTPase, partial [Chlamydiota bacterium]
LDPAVRKYKLPNHQEILLVDTVGFIRKLPHSVVAAFRSTLEEALFCDILIHVIDISHPYAEEQAKATYKVLEELEALERQMITCLNKSDLCKDRSVVGRLQFQYPKVVEISALEKKGFEHLFEMMMEEISALRKVVRLKVPQKEYQYVSRVMKEGKILSCDYEENDVILRVEIPLRLEGELKPFLILK